jgi:hypothetical protein
VLDSPSVENGANMKKARKRPAKRVRTHRDDILPEYDFSGGVRGKYAARFAEGVNIVLLDRDLAESFPTSRAVNQALRQLLKIRPKRRTA